MENTWPGKPRNVRRPKRRSNMLRDTTPTAITLDGQPADDRRVAAVYRCRLQLDQLAATDDPYIKFCEQCKQKVFRVVDFDGFEKAIASKGCIWTAIDADGREVGAQRMFIVGAAENTYLAATAESATNDVP